MSNVAPSGVVTFLFTDIEGSTRRWDADADGMRAALAAHDDLMRATVAAHDGWLFKHTGDGVCAAFSSPRSAVDAAVAAQRALELPVRMGIATGEAELRGDDYFGAVLNRAARVTAAGHGGQILLDGATAELLSDVSLLDLGSRRLRDIARPINVFQVCADGLHSAFAPLSTLDSPPGNLRTPTTSFLGREQEITELQTVLKAHRLVTLTGPGGVGKTRLALEVASRNAHEYPDGVWVIELAPLSDPAAVPEAVAAVLGITQQPRRSLADSVVTALQGRSRLLIFDNCEHVLDATADLIDAVVQRASAVTVLATSREGVRLPDEQLWPVPSLDTQDGATSSAAALFVDRAQTVAPAFALTGTDDASAVAEICRRLDGIPLAIELAASRMQSMSATEVRDRLGDRFRLLTGSRRGLERHQTLRHAVQWSYSLLDESEKSLLTKCSVFAGGFDLAAACAVNESDDELAVLDVLGALVRKSLLVAGTSSGRTRYSMLETIRQFAEEHLVERGEAEHVRHAHARHFAGREGEVLALWDGPRQREAYDWFTIELANIRAAFRWAADHDDIDAAAAIAIYSSLLGFYIPQYEPFAWSAELLGPARAVDFRRLPLLYVTASLCHAAGRGEDFLTYSQAARSAIDSGRYEQVTDLHEAALAGGCITIGQPHRAVEWARNSIAERPNDCLSSKMTLSIALNFVEAPDEASVVAEDVLANSNGNPALECFALLAKGLAHRDTAPAKSYAALREGLSRARESGNTQIESNLAGTFSALAATQGDAEIAFEYFTLSISHFSDSGSPAFMRTPLAALSIFLDRLGYYEIAATLLDTAASPLARAAYPDIDDTIAHLRDVLGTDTYEAFAHRGHSMTNAELSEYALDVVERVRAERSSTRGAAQ